MSRKDDDDIHTTIGLYVPKCSQEEESDTFIKPPEAYTWSNGTIPCYKSDAINVVFINSTIDSIEQLADTMDKLYSK